MIPKAENRFCILVKNGTSLPNINSFINCMNMKLIWEKIIQPIFKILSVFLNY